MSELLPCPFCGLPAEDIVDATRVLGTWRMIHRCPSIGPISIEHANRERLVQRWNTRAALAPEREN